MNIDKYGRTPIYEQIIREIQKEIVSGILKPLDQLPSVRALAMEISINPNTIQKSYSELEHLGICYSSPGQGRFVSKNALEIIRGGKASALNDIQKLTEELLNCGFPLEEIVDCVRRTAENLKRRTDDK